MYLKKYFNHLKQADKFFLLLLLLLFLFFEVYKARSQVDDSGHIYKLKQHIFS
jgi:hypothetical protein